MTGIRSGRARYVVRVASKDGVALARRCEVADRVFPRMRGLLGRAGLSSGGARRASAALELPAGTAAALGLRPGMSLVFTDGAS